MSTEKTQDLIVVGVDGSGHSAAALRWALHQAVLTGARIDAVACWQRPSTAGGFAPAGWVEIDLSEPTREVARTAVAEAVAATPGSVDVAIVTRVVQGYAPSVLVESGADADLLVVGSRGHGELSGMLLGSVGLHCATHATCPVLIVHDTTGVSQA